MARATFVSPMITTSVTGGVPQGLKRTKHGTGAIAILTEETASRQMGYLSAA